MRQYGCIKLVMGGDDDGDDGEAHGVGDADATALGARA